MLDEMVVSMRKAGLAHNTIATYVRQLRTFLNRCNADGIDLGFRLGSQIVVVDHGLDRGMPTLWAGGCTASILPTQLCGTSGSGRSNERETEG